jgi:cytochrome c biogenesis protein CcdA/glutaredoxin
MKAKIILFILALVLISSVSVCAEDLFGSASDNMPIDIVYFYGDGCPHCADFEKWLDEAKGKYNINAVGFEVYFNETNQQLAVGMAEKYGESFKGVPMIIIGNEIIFGFSEMMIPDIESKIQKECIDKCCDSPLATIKQCQIQEDAKSKLTFASVIALAFADSINPCELAVLAMALIALLAHDPTKKKKVLLGGFAFTLAVFITYIIYGLIIIQSFKFIGSYFEAARIYVRFIFAFLAIFIGFMNIKDAIKYKPGSFMTEMPMFMRPMAKGLIKNITRPMGAFIIGVFVTVFLMPCTMGPYFVVGNLLSVFDFVKIIPWLIFYNVIFVLPMILVTLLVYFGFSTVDNVIGWKEKHVKTLHLIAGVVLAVLGILMILGWV